MTLLDVRLLAVKLILDDFDVPLKFFVETSKAASLKSNQIIDVDEMVAERHLVLFLSFIQVTIKHLKDSILGIDFSVVVLLVDLDDLLQLLCFGQTQHLTPMR